MNPDRAKIKVFMQPETSGASESHTWVWQNTRINMPYAIWFTAVLSSWLSKAIAGLSSKHLAAINPQTPLFSEPMNFDVSLCVADKS